jgi:ubiquinol-cytochrome c reductase iron-sulfur subunit
VRWSGDKALLAGTEEAKGSGNVSATEIEDPNRRDFLYVATGMAAVVGAGAFAWPFIDQMRPDASTLALSTVEVDVSSLTPGMSLTVKWRGKPVFVRNRTPEEIKSAQDVKLEELKDPLARNANLPADAKATDVDRSAGKDKENWLVMVGVCTHLGCIPLGQEGEFGGWFCPCHGSVYDTSGRIRSGPAPKNLLVAPYVFTNPNTIRIG